jgi:hypothetical protein
MDTPDDDVVARNRATNPRRTPDREPLGNHLMPRLYAATAAAIVLATVVLVLLLRG